MKLKLLFLLMFIGASILKAQTNEELAIEKAKEAIKLMDSGKLDESILLLKESISLDPENYMYSYEIGLAYVYKKDYDSAIKELKKTRKYKNSSSDIYQLLGNSYSLSGNIKKAQSSYDEGLEIFPNAANLYLEKGNIYLMEKDYEKAIMHYEKGIEVDPKFSSNYYRVAEIFMHSSNKVPGLIYGEIFMNLERTTERTKEMSKMLFRTYNEALQLTADSSKIDFCEIIMDITDISSESEELKLPYCAIYGKNFVLATIGQTSVNLKSLAEMRSTFIELYFQEDSEKYPNVLFSYHKKMIEEKMFKSYNHYLFQIGNEDEFNNWASKNEIEFETFIEWYIDEKNDLKLDKETKYLRTQY